MKNYDAFYQKLSAPYRQSYSKRRFLRLTNHWITRLMYTAYPLLLGYLLVTDRQSVLAYLVIPFVGFVILSLIRKIIDIPRPYERWDIDPLISREGRGQSMPSRHVYSATLISTCFLTVNPWLGLLLLSLSALLAYIRVVGGAHYPRDVIVGLLAGLLTGVLLLLF